MGASGGCFILLNYPGVVGSSRVVWDYPSRVQNGKRYYSSG